MHAIDGILLGNLAPPILNMHYHFGRFGILTFSEKIHYHAVMDLESGDIPTSQLNYTKDGILV